MNLDFDPQTIPILSVAQRCGVTFHHTHKYYVARCPFHHDDTPSFVFYPHTNSWTCFGKCQGKNGHKNGGGVVEFVKQYYHYSFTDALAWLKTNFTYYEPVIISEQKPETIHRVVPHPWVIYWHSLLEEKREYFYSRGFNDDFINREMWGWNGQRYCLPVWEGEPGNSDILGVRQRKPDNQEKGFKYIGLKDHNSSGVVWGKWYCRNAKTIVATAGEFDAARLVQLGIPSFSVINGINSIEGYPPNWADLWFPKSHNMIVCFDIKEEVQAAKLAHNWNKIKGSMTARIFQWSSMLEVKDFCEFANKFNENTKDKFFELIKLQNLKYEL